MLSNFIITLIHGLTNQSAICHIEDTDAAISDLSGFSCSLLMRFIKPHIRINIHIRYHHLCLMCIFMFVCVVKCTLQTQTQGREDRSCDLQ